jgi:hypothetical protein
VLVAAAVAAALSVLAPGASAPALAAPQATPMSRPASSGMTSYEPPAIAIIAIPDLRWTDLAAMPRLRAFARSSAVGNLSVKTPGSRAGCADGLLTFGAGNRVSAGVNGCTVTPGDFLAAEHAAETGPFGANVGAFGEALHTAQLGAQALDPFAFPMVARPEDARTSVPAEQSDGHLPVVSAAVDVDLYRVRPGRRAAAALQLDRKITGQLAEAPGASYLVIAGISDGATGSSHLHPLLISHPGWHNVELARPGSRPPYVELIDLAPTILHWLGRAPPDSMAGRVLRVTATPARDPAAYNDEDLHAQAARTASKPLRWTLAISVLAVVLLLVLALRRPDRNAAAATWLSRLVVAVPVGAFLLQLLPWWRWPGLAVVAALVVVAVIGAVAMTVVGRRGEVAALLVVPAATFVVLLLDQLAHSPLQLSAPLGDNPLIAGRFHGMGNIDFALFATAALLCAGVVGGHLVAAGSRGEGVLIATLIAGVALVVDGAPSFGDDAGGAVALLPAIVVMLGVLLGIRVTWRRALTVVVVAVVAISVLGVADHARGAGAQTHLGRFVGQVLHGGAGTVVQRRLTAVGRSFGNVVFTLLVLAATVAVVMCWNAFRQRVAPVPGLLAALAGVVVLAVLGSLLNDSGVAVAAFVLILAVTALGGSILARTVTRAPGSPQGGIIEA